MRNLMLVLRPSLLILGPMVVVARPAVLARKGPAWCVSSPMHADRNRA